MSAERYQFADTLIYRDQGETATLFDAATGTIFAGNDSAAVILRALGERPCTAEDLVEVIRQHYEVDGQDVMAAVTAFLGDLRDKQLIVNG